MDPFQASIPQIVNFLLYLFHEKKLSFKSIGGYRTAISRPIKLCTGLDVGQDPLLHNLLKSFLKERQRALQQFPAWDLSFVFSLVKELFEPLSEISLKLLTFKTVFLTLLAAGCRRGEILAINYSTVTHSPNWTNVVLNLVSGLMSKTQLRSKGTSALELISIPSLGHALCQDLAEDGHTCAVRCLKVCLAGTKPFWEGKRHFFISYQKNKISDISKNTITSWIRGLLHFIFSNANRDTATLARRSTHAMAASSAFSFSGQVELDEVLKNCSWKKHTTFSEFHLKDMTQVRDYLLLGSCGCCEKAGCALKHH